MSMADTRDGLKAAQARIAAFSRASPKLFAAFAEVSRSASAAGSFTAAQKELMAVAIAVAQGCEDCILYHADAAIRHGAEERQLVEALDVAVEMGGGPAVMYAGKALEAFRGLK
jgi:AhpD family alkylhydroperoxidase